MDALKSSLILFAIAIAFSLVFMWCLWWVSRKVQNAGIVDVAWSALIAVCALFYLTVLDGYFLRKIMAGLMVSFWGFRLSLHVFYRNLVSKQEDSRYANLRKGWGQEHESKMRSFYLIQGLAAAVFSIPYLIVAFNATQKIMIAEYIGFIIFMDALVGESLADYQLQRFKMNPENKGKTCQVGLWKYSRHPNYFFEWLVWCGVFIFALGSPYGWISIFCPILIYHFLVNVTGIPKAEEQSLKSRGEEYREYQRRTNAFFPGFPKT